MTTRRDFLRIVPLGAVTAFAPSFPELRRCAKHPEPRPGIDGTKVLQREALAAFPEETQAVYDMVREMPHIADGIGCSCGCSAMPGYRSLLTCYQAGGMAMGCAICQGQGRLAYRRFKEGQTLEQIRRATDARFG
jgi:hypothetical protein